MSSSRSRSSTSANQTQTTNTQNLNLQDNDGIALADVSGSVTITTTDFDALRTAGEISSDAVALGREGLEAGRSGFEIGAELAGRGIDSAIGSIRDTSRDAMGFAEVLSGRSLDTVTGLADSAFSTVSGANRDAFDFADRSLSTVSSLAGDSISAITGLAEGAGSFARALVGDTVAGFKDLTMQTSASTDDRVAKVAMYAFLAVAAAIVLPAIFRS